MSDCAKHGWLSAQGHCPECYEVRTAHYGGLQAWMPATTSGPFFGLDRSLGDSLEQLRPNIKKVTIWERLGAAWRAFNER